jgi:adenine/guanine phosphoribosyltransferase-like PRPP-binding protein
MFYYKLGFILHLQKEIELKTGLLKVKSGDILDELTGFSSRLNKKRGFLFVSKVLGKHIPCKPSAMKKVHKLLAEKLKLELKDFNTPTVVIGFAETATGIGNGVYDELNLPNSFYIHTTRYQLSFPKLAEFKEEHSHAPAQLLYQVKDDDMKDILLKAENIILVDDEITTGKTLKNIIKELKEILPNAKNYFAVSILNWMKEFDSELSYTYLLDGDFSFESFNCEPTENFISETENTNFLDEIIPNNFGRFGIKNTNIDYSKYINIEELKNKKVLVIGTSEFMYQSYLVGSYLEENSVDVYVQSTTRSPINVDGDILSRINFKDNYGENIDNFIYNVIDKKYDKVFILYETKEISQHHNLKEQLDKYFYDVEIIIF